MTESLAQRCSAIVPTLAARAPLAERERRLPAESIAELTAIGVFRSLTPRRYGGNQLATVAAYSALIELGRGCASTAWVATLFAAHGFLITAFDPRAQDDVWAAGPDALIASSIAPVGEAKAVDGGFVVRGKWSFASGVDHATWIVLCAFVKDDRDAEKPPFQHFFIIPAADYTIEDDWQVSGLCATGSKSVRLTDVFVPAHRADAVVRLMSRPLPWHALFGLIFSAPAVGNALGMLDDFRAHLAARRGVYTGEAFKDRPTSLVRLAEAAAEIDAARLILLRDLHEIDEAVASGRPLRRASYDRIQYDAAYIVQTCARAVDRLFAASGGRALYATSVLQRRFRDMHANTQHAFVDLDVAGERYGKALVDTATRD
jgi:alkylation response protein AidB-like acyl-CoA dehydrogenase